VPVVECVVPPAAPGRADAVEVVAGADGAAPKRGVVPVAVAVRDRKEPVDRAEGKPTGGESGAGPAGIRAPTMSP
jgi:hypothetical protein